METRARVVLIGLFMLAATAAVFGFVYWLHSSGGLGDSASYRIRFENSAVGLRSGSSVLFNGIRVGEVTEVRLNSADPREVTVLIAVERSTPIRADTRVEIFTQGLMGSPTVALIGGAPTAPPLASAERVPPLLIAEPNAGQDVMQAARDLIRRLDKLVAENSEALRNTITNLSTFSDALARNSGRLDAIAEGLVRMTGGGPAKAPPTVYDLTAPRAFPGLAKVPGPAARDPRADRNTRAGHAANSCQRRPGRAPGFRGRAMERQHSEAHSGANNSKLRERPVSASRSRERNHTRGFPARDRPAQFPPGRVAPTCRRGRVRRQNPRPGRARRADPDFLGRGSGQGRQRAGGGGSSRCRLPEGGDGTGNLDRRHALTHFEAQRGNLIAAESSRARSPRPIWRYRRACGRRARRACSAWPRCRTRRSASSGLAPKNIAQRLVELRNDRRRRAGRRIERVPGGDVVTAAPRSRSRSARSGSPPCAPCRSPQALLACCPRAPSAPPHRCR